MNRNHRTTLPSAALFGLTLAAAVLVKGSLIFLPPLFMGYIAPQILRNRRYRLSVLTTTLLAFLLPVVAYSAYATHANGSFVLLSRQGRSVLLAGNNEIAVETVGWSPQWREDPNSFFSQKIAPDPDRSAASLIAFFYARNPTLLVKAIPRKLVAMFGTKTAVLIGIALFYAATAFATCLVRGQAPQRLIVLLSLVAVAGLVMGASSPQLQALVVVFAFGPGLLLFALACLNHCFRKRVSAFWNSPGWVAVILVITNFVLVAIVVFGDPRFVAPARFVLLLAASFLLIRLAAALGLPADSALTLEEEGPT